MSQAATQIAEVLGPSFQGDAHAYLMSIYKDTTKPDNLRVDAAKTAIRYERPALSPVDLTHTNPDFVPLHERLREYTRADAIKQTDPESDMGKEALAILRGMARSRPRD